MRNTRRKGVSPVIATVILVAIAIVVSIAAAFWMTGLLSSFTAYERLTLSASISKSGTTYTLTITVVNDGTTTATVQKIFINAVDKSSSFITTPPQNIDPGDSKTFSISGNAGTLGITPGRPFRITVVTLRGSYETQLTAP